MNVLNIHGYHGSPQNAAFSALQELGCNVISPEIDYDAEEPEGLLEKLKACIQEQHIERIVGTSFGGFFAAVLCAELHIPAVFVNPCLLPFLHLPRLGYTQDVRPLIAAFGALSGMDRSIVSCIVGADDEIIDTHDFTKNMLYNARYRVIAGGKHSGSTLPLKAYFEEVL